MLLFVDDRSIYKEIKNPDDYTSKITKSLKMFYIVLGSNYSNIPNNHTCTGIYFK